jgi:small subunit ribosomal protein S17
MVKEDKQNIGWNGESVLEGYPLRGRQFVGKVLRASTHKTAVIEWPRLFFIPKYQRYEKRRSKMSVHIPDSIKIEVGQMVRVVETRPISKTKNFIIVEVVK